ncbi:sensor histidine kinase [Streptomyces griseomycini]|uniref:Two-component system sensor histidine kinase DesK n=1 Tax=Streptomyces griseomycini TaxID=66895 RepID=A0A7W7LWM0_9ACTN|nr:sensor histidine kinase [Streptomyces griseomycini]MBB4897790.1 two-component system sensor histidine kinase DesK [Streptomyces griseomycini]GGQ32321.1 histidine kinase [Streptomyces griseomycini]GGR48595.1 histidine kinase [Streptomyces griseomycini]
MGRPGGWWGRKSTPAKVETYTRWSFHSLALVELLVAGGPVIGQVGPRLAALLLLMTAVHSVVCGVTASRALDWLRGRREQPVRTLWTLGATTAAVAVASLVVAEHGPSGEDADGAAGGVFSIVVIFGVGAAVLGVRGRRRVFATVAGFAAGAGAIAVPLGLPWPVALVTALFVLAGSGFFAFLSLFSVWLLNAFYELDEARETRAQLAVAEERLRFGRDLHDVMGRNLAVIALKSELAVQLAQRERPEAVTQMVEVQRLAHEAQREVREVVRGYREADLAGELAGAQGVLTAAGIDCTVTGPVAGLPAPVQSALGWVVREAATNVLRHGDAQRCTVGLRMREGRVVLTVENDGVPQTGGPGRGAGLVGLRERLAEIGGTLRAGPTGDGRFLLTAEVPLPSHSGEAPPAALTTAPAPLPVSSRE